MHIRFDGRPVTAGDPDSVALIFNNLCGANFSNKAAWAGYISMMNADFYAEDPLEEGTRVDLVCHDLTYATFVHATDQIRGVGQDDIARIYQMHQPRRLFSEEDARSIYEEAGAWSEQGLPLNNPFCPYTEFQKFQAFAWGQFRVLAGDDYLRLCKLQATASSAQERDLFKSICQASPWYGDERIGARLKEELFRESIPF